MLGNAGISSDQAKIPFIENADKLPRSLQSLEVGLLRQMNEEHLAASGVALDSPTVWLKNERRLRGIESVPVRTFIGVDRSHWWLIARRAS